MPVYNFAKIRELLTAAFSSGEINTLAFDLFRPLYDDFSGGMSKGDRIEQIVMEADRNGRIPQLLYYVQEKNAYQYGRFASQLIQEEPMPNPTNQLAGWQQRQADLKQHTEKDTKLLQDFEDALRAETHPQRRLSYEQGIERQQEALAKWRRELAQLEGEIVQDAPSNDLGHQILTEVRTLQQTITQQHAETTQSLAGLTAGQSKIMAHIDAKHQQTMATVLKRLDESQYELVGLMLDAAERQQISYQEAVDLTDLTQKVLRLLEQQPDSVYWHDLLIAVEEPVTLENKLKLTLPIIPTILEYEAEFAVDGFGWLKEAWQTIANRIRPR